MSIGDRPLIAKGIDFQIQNNGRKLTFSPGFSLFIENNILSDFKLVYTKNIRQIALINCL